jgi:DNA modification methylase
MEYSQKAVKDLIPYINNARTHSDEQVTQIASSIREFGFINPIIIDDKNNVIAGHGRLLASKKLGLKEVPTVLVDHLTDTQRKAYILADNQLALNAGWDDELLKIELAQLDDVGFDLELLGFDLGALEGLGVEELELEEQAIPEPAEDPISKLGDIWTLGNHRLMCGDSIQFSDVEKLMGGQKADLVFTDPPYGISYQSNGRTKSQKFDVLKNDDVILDIVPNIELFSNGWVFIWTTWKVLDKWLEVTKPLGFPSNMVIWFKGGGGIGDLKKTFSTDYETALVWHRGAELCGKRIGSVWKVGKDGASDYVHPTQKPVELAFEAMDKTTKAKAKVLDLFGGSGSTLIACEKLKRKGFIMELDPKYCDVIIKRWQNLTGNDAVLESTGETYNSLEV